MIFCSYILFIDKQMTEKKYRKKATFSDDVEHTKLFSIRRITNMEREFFILFFPAITQIL